MAKLYGVGVGPGDPELLTLKAVRIIKSSKVIAIAGESRESCLAYKIAAGAAEGLDEKEILCLNLPMTRDKESMRAAHEKAVLSISECLEKNKDIAFLVLGDPAIYSTYMYIHGKLKEEGFEAELVSGVNSFSLAAARLEISLAQGDEALHIIPASYDFDSSAAPDGNTVFMKSGKDMKRIVESIDKSRYDIYLAENCGLESERLFKAGENLPESSGYYTLIISKEKRD